MWAFIFLKYYDIQYIGFIGWSIFPTSCENPHCRPSEGEVALKPPRRRDQSVSIQQEHTHRSAPIYRPVLRVCRETRPCRFRSLRRLPVPSAIDFTFVMLVFSRAYTAPHNLGQASQPSGSPLIPRDSTFRCYPLTANNLIFNWNDKQCLLVLLLPVGSSRVLLDFLFNLRSTFGLNSHFLSGFNSHVVLVLTGCCSKCIYIVIFFIVSLSFIDVYCINVVLLCSLVLTSVCAVWIFPAFRLFIKKSIQYIWCLELKDWLIIWQNDDCTILLHIYIYVYCVYILKWKTTEVFTLFWRFLFLVLHTYGWKSHHPSDFLLLF